MEGCTTHFHSLSTGLGGHLINQDPIPHNIGVVLEIGPCTHTHTHTIKLILSSCLRLSDQFKPTLPPPGVKIHFSSNFTFYEKVETIVYCHPYGVPENIEL